MIVITVLSRHQSEIEDICHCASKELELEVKLRITEEEWTEQVLTFTDYKRRGPIYLEKDSMEHLLEQLENAQAILASMLTSRYVGPLREEAAGWAEKLRGKECFPSIKIYTMTVVPWTIYGNTFKFDVTVLYMYIQQANSPKYKD